MGEALWIGPAIVAAAIATLINVAGWFVTFRQARSLERERRNEKIVDVQTALLAEIRSDLQNLGQIDVEDSIASLRRMLEAVKPDAPYTPFVPRDAGSIVFSAVVDEIAILPNKVIDPVVLYYKQRDAIAHLTEDLRASSFATLQADRKLAMMEDYLRLKAFAAVLAREAVGAIERSLGLPVTVNSTASDPSGRQSASEASVSGRSSSTSSHPSYKPR